MVGSEYAPLPRGRSDDLLTIGFPPHYREIQRTMLIENCFSPLDKRINPSLFSDKWRSRWRRIAKDVQSDSIGFQRPIYIPMAIPLQ
jgi:hypothetical protein